MIAGSPLFQNLGLASGMNPLDAPETGDPKPGAAKLPAQPVLPAPGAKVVIPGAADMPLYKPEDTVHLKIQDTRKVNPATGQPFKDGGPMTTAVNPKYASYIIKHALSKGVDPNTALAIGLQETKMGNMNENMGSAWGTFADEGIEDPYEQGANTMVKALADKLAYAKRLGYDKKGEAYSLQAYNGYGKLKPQNTDPNATESFYGIPVTHKNPLNMATNPVYGKTIMSLRDEIIKKNPELQKLIQQAMAVNRTTPMTAPALAYNQ
jgi:hypothetical protein